MKAIIDISYNLQSLMDVLGLIQGISFGILLLLLNYRHFRNTYLLGIFLLLFSLKLLVFIPAGLNIDQEHPELFLLPFDFSWLLFPIFFVYTQKISIFSDQKIKYWVLYPGIISFVLQAVIYFLPYDTKLEIAQSFWHEFLFTILGICYSWVIGIWNLRLINQHRKEVENTFSDLENKVLGWARIFLIYLLITSVLVHVLFYVSPENYYFKIMFSIFDLIAIYWLSVNGIIQQNVLSLINDKKNSPATILLENKNGVMEKEDDDNLKSVMTKIDTYMKDTEVFLMSELTIIDLADQLKMHPKKISASINTIFKQNFNTYVNYLRIKKAEYLLSKRSTDYLSIEGVGKEVGFHSKSAFYAAFKRVTGTTPKNYKESISG
ncbi:MAG: helix-turn-helix transcriptional regulator [Flavobacteriaceae bacterium]|nr:helix-turn-helix domain-containing protein [Bacteroidia bacterium]MBT8284617.1 helix-turn-helix domain-containing protein [Muriicola sp.]NNC61826.1 helix-turn-helix transcriptional regulator [Eudoraea sp.]NNK10880.1 helix-turn-helix transcriptional regulator [Flavobacteriaceae bacterium]MBT8291372.1 helix-turn-helix domain-containing protein [Muriicola sp.]